MNEARKFSDVIKRYNDVYKTDNKYTKLFKGYILNDLDIMNLSVDGDLYYPTETAAIKAAFVKAYKDSKEAGSTILNLSKNEPSSVYNIQMLLIKVPTKKFDPENVILGDDDSMYIRIKDFDERKVSFSEYEVTNLAYRLEDDNLIIEQMDFKESSGSVKIEEF